VASRRPCSGSGFDRRGADEVLIDVARQVLLRDMVPFGPVFVRRFPREPAAVAGAPVQGLASRTTPAEPDPSSPGGCMQRNAASKK